MKNTVVRLSSIADLVPYGSLFEEGYRELERKKLVKVSWSDYLKMIMEIISVGDLGWVGVVQSTKRGIPLGYAVTYDDTRKYGPRQFFVYAAYNNMKDENALLDLMQAFEEFLTSQDIKVWRMSTRRNTKAALKCFGDKYGMHPDSLYFIKEI